MSEAAPQTDQQGEVVFPGETPRSATAWGLLPKSDVTSFGAGSA